MADYQGTGSFHKVNRNGRQTVRFSGSTNYSDDSYTQTVKYDNWHHQHAIPQTDVQYAWISSSLISDYSGTALFDYESKDLSKGDFASSDLMFRGVLVMILDLLVQVFLIFSKLLILREQIR